jgi:Ca2+-binding RTX toxin-like protein
MSRYLSRRAAIAVAAAAVAATGGAVADPAGAATSAQIEDGTLQISGDGASDRLALINTTTAFVLDVDADGTADFTFDRNAFTAIDVKARGGDDTVDVVRGGGPADKAITIDGGGGDDTLRGSDGAETFLGGAGDDFVDGNTGADVAQLGSGADRFRWDPGDGSDTVEGQGGDDALDFNGSNASEKVNVEANGSRVRFTRDVAAIDMDLDDLERLNFRAVGGADTVRIGDLGGTGVHLTAVDLAALTGEGDAAADTVIAEGTGAADRFDVGAAPAGGVLVSGPNAAVQVTGGEAQDNLDVAALGGPDTVAGGVGLPGPMPVTADGGDAADSVTYKGSPGDDTIGIQRNGDAVGTFTPGGGVLNSTAVESLDVDGRDGADAITAGNGIGTLTQLTLAGGAGDDGLRGGDGADVLLGGAGDDQVDGNTGADVARLGSGDDRFRWDPGDGSDTVEGQGGDDALDFNGSNAAERMELSRNGGRVRFFRDVAAITMDINDVESLVVRALGGADTVTVGDLKGTGLDSTEIALASSTGEGDAAADTVIQNGTDRADRVDVSRYGSTVQSAGLVPRLTISGSEPANDRLQVNTLAGDDEVTVAPDVAGLIQPLVDLGGDE